GDERLAIGIGVGRERCKGLLVPGLGDARLRQVEAGILRDDAVEQLGEFLRGDHAVAAAVRAPHDVGELGVPAVIVGDDQLRDGRRLLEAVVAVIDAGLLIDAEMLRTAGVGVVVLIAAHRIGRIVLVAAVVGRNRPALRELDAGGALGVGVETAVG